MTTTFYAIYNTDTKMFKTKSKKWGASWSKNPTSTYDSKGRAEAALKSHLKLTGFYRNAIITGAVSPLVVVPIELTWNV